MRGRPTSVAIVTLLATLLLASAGSSAHAAFPGPNGKIALQGGGFGSEPGIPLVNPDGSGGTRIQAAGSTGPVWSPDGRWLAYSTFPDPWTIRVVRADGTGDREVLSARAGTPPTHNVYSWSPTGTEIAYQCAQGICAVRVADGATRVILGYTFAPQEAIRPSWSPTGSKIAFQCRFAARSELCLVNPDGTDPEVYVSPPGISESSPDWSPDGSRILFTGGGGISALDVDDGETRLLTNLVGTARWSPDGRRIVVATTAGSYVVALDGGQSVKIADGRAGDWGTSPAVTVSESRLEPRWILSRQTGLLRLGGTASHASSLTVAVRSAGRTYPAASASVPAGEYAVAIPLPADLLPGPLEVLVGGTSGSEALLTVVRAESLAAPASGLVSRSWISRTPRGAPRARVPRGTKTLHAQFAFSVRPAAGQRLRAVWLAPSGAVRSTARVASARVVSAPLSSGTALTPGRWRCRLEASGVPLAIASVRVG